MEKIHAGGGAHSNRATTEYECTGLLRYKLLQSDKSAQIQYNLTLTKARNYDADTITYQLSTDLTFSKTENLTISLLVKLICQHFLRVNVSALSSKSSL